MKLLIPRWLSAMILSGTVAAQAPQAPPVHDIILKADRIQDHDPKGALALLDSLDRAVDFSLDDSLYFLNVRGWTYQILTEVDKGMEDLRAGIELSEATGNDSARAHFLSHFGTSLYQTGQHFKAIEKYAEAAELAGRTNDWSTRFASMVNIGAVFIEEEMLDTAGHIIGSAIALYEQHETAPSFRLARTYRILGKLYEGKGEYSKGEEVYRKTIDIAASLGDTLMLAEGNAYMAGLLVHAGRFDEAIEHAEKAIAYQESIEIGIYKASTLHYYAIALNAVGRYREAYDAMSEVHTIERGLFNERIEKRVTEMEVKYETERLAHEKELAEQEAQTNALALQVERGKNRILLLGIAVAVLVLAIVVIIVYLRNRHLTALQREALQQARLSAVIIGEERERGRIARELHDGVSQLLVALNLNLNRIGIKDRHVKELLHLAMETVREVSHNLLPQQLSEEGLIQALREAVERVNHSEEVHIEFIAETESVSLSTEAQTNLYRIAQEVLNNTIKHARASLIQIRLALQGDGLVLSIQDNGIGLNEEQIEQSAGIGWKNILARLEMLKGRMDLVSSSEHGTTLNFVVPV